ncbi:hypothetical protein H9Q72_011210 [Fusarium xylarioides]|uniref:RRM domain-containing protein n=1 Tax=Fusarium xylarioides TaxID=221167 RepID=A0A9P7L0Y7_9HYPO|nr:hypothetical protein H9Q70_011489 [Fusarium xylarioides]KAG5760667.1 hypothetical protein H9Q72_011210 [Fusarium xylarioides]KAG5774753.1 hypothetical protein H9Q73_011582 [Fusarium xylarioides]KAG5805491.1 hypothetical protein H9Q71_009936 [Fusarium xylarioides]KAG5818624.1 hypothetical protein H9Q74_009969 [Fusarium xylarioides]
MDQGAIPKEMVVNLANIDFAAGKKDVENLVRGKGFIAKFYWPEKSPKDNKAHKGWCWIVFTMKATAGRAVGALNDASLNGRQLKARIVRQNATALKAQGPGSGYRQASGSLRPPGHPESAGTKPGHLQISGHPEPIPPESGNRQTSNPSPAPGHPKSAGTKPGHGQSVATNSSQQEAMQKNTDLSKAAGTMSTAAPQAIAVADDSSDSSTYPSSWKYNPEHPDIFYQSFMKKMKQEDATLGKKGIVSRPRVIEHPNGRMNLRSIQVPSPHPLNDEAAKMTFIYVQKCSKNEENLFKRISLDQLPAHLADD